MCGLASALAASALSVGGTSCQRGARPRPASPAATRGSGDPSAPTQPVTARSAGADRQSAEAYPILDVAGSHRAIGRAVGESFRDLIQQAVVPQPGYRACLTTARGAGSRRVAAFEAAVRKAYPQLIEELEGMGEGCGLPFADLFAWNCRSELDAAADPCPPGCSTVGWVDSSTMILAHNEDGGQSYDGRMFVLRARPPSGIRFAVLVYPGTWPGNGPGFNDRGVVQTANYISPCDVAAGIPRYVVGRAVLEAPSLDRAVAIATQSGRAFPWHHNLASLPESKLVSLETWPGRHHRRDVRGLHLHTNHLTHPEMRDLPERKAYLARSSKPRFEALERRLVGTTPSSSTELVAALQDRSGVPCKVCRRPGDEVPGITVATAIFEAPQRRMVLRGGATCDGPPQVVDL